MQRNGFVVVLTLLALAFGSLGITPAKADTLAVTSNADSGAGSLRQAISDAAPGATITFDATLAGQAIILASTLTLDRNIAIDGSSLALPVTISGNNAVRVFYVNSGVTVTLNSLIVANGYVYNVDGGGIYNHGALTIIDSAFSGNSAIWGSGGGIYSYLGALTINNSTFSDNLAWIAGGGILNRGGTASITNSIFSDNSAKFGGNSVITFGGGLCNEGGVVTITGSTFSGNSASDAFGGNYIGGGVHNDSGTVSITDSTFSANSAGNGGGLSNYDTVTITNSTFSGNSVSFGGGGLYNRGTVSITGSTFSSNSSIDSGGGIYNGDTYGDGDTVTVISSTFSGNSAYYGGGIYNNSGILQITASTFSGNSATTNGGGIYAIGVMVNGAVTITNSTFSGNSAILDYGGGIYNCLGSVPITITNSTISGNSAADTGGGIFSPGKATLVNTIIANSVSGGNCDGVITNGGNNLDDGTTCGFGSANGSLGSTNPQLGALTGSPAYFPLAAGSPAIGAVTYNAPNGCPTTDQRGVARPQGVYCDIGAYESAVFQRVTNGGFETYIRTAKIPWRWKAINFGLLDGKDTKVRKYEQASLKIVSSGMVTKTLTQTLALSGVTGDAFDLSFWARGSALPKTGICKMDITFYNGTTKVGLFSKPCPTTSNFKWKKVTAPTYRTTSAYTKVVIKITFKKASGAIWFDGVSLMR